MGPKDSDGIDVGATCNGRVFYGRDDSVRVAYVSDFRLRSSKLYLPPTLLAKKPLVVLGYGEDASSIFIPLRETAVSYGFDIDDLIKDQ